MGEIIKFGRVPFIIKESSVQLGIRGEEIVVKEENETMERNLTDIESLDYYNYINNGSILQQ